MKTIFVTGCDSGYFLMTGILLEAFKKQCPFQTLRVCDFGLANNQRELLLREGVLLQKPSLLSGDHHPWIYKSSLYHYIKHLSADIVVWMDSDCFPVGPFSQEVEKIISDWEKGDDRVALCQGKVGKTWGLASPQSNISHFNMRPDYPYYNSGLWILHSEAVLKEWASVINSTPKNGMFEQDAFNFLLHKNNTKIKTLKNDIWNVTHDSLNLLEINPATNRVLLNGQDVLIIHLTGDFTTVNITVGPFSGTIRTLPDVQLRDMQVRLIKKWVISLCK